MYSLPISQTSSLFGMLFGTVSGLVGQSVVPAGWLDAHCAACPVGHLFSTLLSSEAAAELPYDAMPAEAVRDYYTMMGEERADQLFETFQGWREA